MSEITASLPTPNRSDIAVAVVDRWVVREDALAVADAVLAAWADRPLPSGLASASCFTGSRGDVVLAYQQWTSRQAQQQFSMSSDVYASVAADRDAAVEYIRYRSITSGDGTPPGCVVFVTFAFVSDGMAKAWADLLIDAIEAQEAPTAGCLARHLHISADGRTVLNYSEWATEADHRASIESPVRSPEWQRVEDFPGMTHGPGARCRLRGTVSG